MRPLILPMLVAALASAPMRVTPAPGPLILIVHGRGVRVEDSVALRREWTQSLDEGLKLAGLPSLNAAAADVRVVWYADVLDPAGSGQCVQPTDSLDAGGTVRGFLAILGAAMDQEGAGDARALLGDLLYMLDPATRCGARRRVSRAIVDATRGGRPVLVLAYSLGSLVAYDALAALDSTPTRDIRLVTVGSPLGVPLIRELLGGGGGDSKLRALRRPRAVRSWTNLYDDRDVFAAPLDIDSVVDSRITPDSTRVDAHHFDGYLRDRETGAALARALCGGAHVAGCARD